MRRRRPFLPERHPLRASEVNFTWSSSAARLGIELATIYHPFHFAFAARQLVGSDYEYVRVQSQRLAQIFADGCL